MRRFILTRILDLIENEPEIDSLGPLGTRREFLRGFPSFVVYEVTEKHLCIN